MHRAVRRPRDLHLIGEGDRYKVKQLQIEPLGGFAEVHFATPLEVCEQCGRKGFYGKAHVGIVKEFTGISERTTRRKSGTAHRHAGRVAGRGCAAGDPQAGRVGITRYPD